MTAVAAPAVLSRSWDLWTTTAQVVVRGEDPRALDAAEAEVRRVTDEVEAACSRFRPDSELMRRSADLVDGCEVSEALAGLVRIALDAAAATDGDVDPALGSRMISLGYDLARPIAPELPDAGAPGLAPVSSWPLGARGHDRDVAGSGSRWRGVVLDGRRLRIPEGVVLDLGATAKAAAADAAAAAAHRATGAGVLVSLGGDIATAGAGPAGGWQVLVQDVDGDPAQTVTLADGWAIATSSTRRRRWERDGTPMHHILDPRWGVPAAPVWRSVTIAAPTCATANTWSTAAVVRGARAVADLEALRLPARFVDASRRVVTTSPWPSD